MTIPREIIESTISRLLTEMYFCDGAWIGPGHLNGPGVGARVTFSGPLRGEFRIVATPRLAAQFAADFIAEDLSDITSRQAVGLLHEFANIACGAALHAWVPDGNFNFSVPSSLKADEAEEQWSQRLCITDNQPELAAAFIFSPPESPL